MDSKKFIFIFSSLLIVTSLILYMVTFSSPSVEKDLRAQYLKGGNFRLSHQGEPFELKQLLGAPVVLYFGYTYCPDVCPIGLAVIRDALNSSSQLKDVPVLFVTLDPERDSEKTLSEYVSFFHANIIPLRGNVQEIKSVIEAYGGFFRIPESSNSDAEQQSYTVDHSAYYYVIDSFGELTRVYDHSVSSNELAETLTSLL